MKKICFTFLVNDDHIFNCCNITNKKAYFAFYSLFTSTHVSAFHNFSELKCVFFLFMIVGINSNSCRNWKVHERKTKKKKYRNWMGEQNRRERKYGVSYTILWLLQTESTRKTVRDSQLMTWREKVSQSCDNAEHYSNNVHIYIYVFIYIYIYI